MMLLSGGNLTVTGNASILGNADIGNADTDTVTFTALVDSAILPDATANSRDLGSTAKDLESSLWNYSSSYYRYYY